MSMISHKTLYAVYTEEATARTMILDIENHSQPGSPPDRAVVVLAAVVVDVVFVCNSSVRFAAHRGHQQRETTTATA